MSLLRTDSAAVDTVDGTDLVRVSGARVAFGAVEVLHDVNLTLRQGDFVGVVGPSGAGKTSLLRLILGTLSPSGGTVTLPRGLTIGYVPQLETVDWNFPVTVAECVLMSRRAGILPWSTASERAAVARVLDQLGIGDLAGRHIRELSGGQQQRMFLARALLRDPQLLLLDEPTSGIDVNTRHEMLHLLGSLHARGVAIMLTTHDLNGVAAHVPDLIALHRTVVSRGAPREVMTSTVLEHTFGAPVEVLQHLGMPVVLDRPAAPDRRHAV